MGRPGWGVRIPAGPQDLLVPWPLSPTRTALPRELGLTLLHTCPPP